MANSLLRRGRFPRGPWTTHLSLPGCWTKASISSSPAVCGAKPSRTLYEVLGVEPSADQATIKEAFYAKSKELHPDSAVAQGVENAGEAFRELAAAYEVLRDPNTRKEYDDSKKSTFQSSRVQGRAHQGVRREYRPPPEFGRRVDVDLSPERMSKAWAAYKRRWELEEERLLHLEEKKLKFRLEFDKARRENFCNMSAPQRDRLRQNLSHLRTTNQFTETFSSNVGDGRVHGEAPRPEVNKRTASDPDARHEDAEKGERFFERRFKEEMQGRQSDPFASPFNVSFGEDPLLKGLNQEGGGGKSSRQPIFQDIFQGIAENSKTKYQNLRENWESSSFMSHNTQSVHGYAGHRSMETRIPMILVVTVVAIFFGLSIYDVTLNRVDWQKENVFLAQLEKEEQDRRLRKEKLDKP